VLCVGGHAFLLDFGVAKLEASAGSTLTGPGLAIGTPGYMAPEQAAGQVVDHRADIYAWGLLARELLTSSRHPSARVEDRPGLPPTLAALVAASLAIDPDERPNSAGSLVAALDGMMAPVVAERPSWPWLAAAALVLGGGLTWWATGRDSGMPMVSSVASPIAVAPLRDETGDPALAALGRLAGDWITQGLHESGASGVVAWPAARAAVEQAHDDRDDATRLRDATGAGTAVVGSYYLMGDSVSFQVEIIDTRRHLVLAAPAPIIVHRDSGATAVRHLRQRVMGALAVQQDDRLARGPTFAVTPPTYAAYRSFDRGLVAFDDYRYAEALDAMLAAWRLDTTFTSALVYAAYAAWNDGERPLADSLIHELDLRRNALSEYQLGITGFIAGRLAGDFGAALAGAIRAWEAAPGSRAGYNAAQALLALNRPVEAIARLDSLDPDTGPMRGWSAYWSQRAYAAHLLGDHDREYADAEEMARRHPDKRVAGVIKSRALAAMGRTKALDSLLDAHAGMPPDTYWSQGAMRVVAGEELLAHADRDRAERYLRGAVAWLESRLAVVPGNADHEYWLASAMVALEQWEDAARVVERLLAADPERVLYRGMAASLGARLGASGRAGQLLDSIPPWSRGEGLVFQARVAAVEGRSEDAIELIDQALQSGFDGWHWVHGSALHDLATLRDDPRFRRVTAKRTS
jgi:tetratricopeptide (TPR) repeat protein